MTIDERLQCLLQSTESLYATTQELHATADKLSEQIAEHTKQLQIDAENIRALARIAESTIAASQDWREESNRESKPTLL